MSGASCDVTSLAATRVQFGLGAVLHHSITPRGRIADTAICDVAELSGRCRPEYKESLKGKK